MLDLRAHPFASAIAAVALIMPPPTAEGKSLTVFTCNGGLQRIDLPADPSHRDEHDCCRKGCHAANDRRKRNGAAESCC